MSFSIIAAVSENNAIGLDGKMPWHLSEDLMRFRKLTYGKTVIMGKKTYDSLPIKPLPHRRNIVITRSKIESCICIDNIQDSIHMCDSKEENFIIGGSLIYNWFLYLSDTIYLTIIHKNYIGDTFFNLNYSNWNIIEKYTCFSHENNFEYSFLKLIKNADIFTV